MAFGNSPFVDRAAARSGENLMPRIVSAVESYATVGEIADVLRGVQGIRSGLSACRICGHGGLR
ncbi:hypothetical protein JAO29_05450 [Edaphobacter sp. HDX4]